MLIRKLGSLFRQVSTGLVLAGGVSVTAQAASVNVSASPSSTTVGNSVSVFFDIAGLGVSSLSLYAFQVSFDNAVLSFNSFSFVDPNSLRNELDLVEPSSPGFTGDVTNLGGGVLDVFALSGNSPGVLDANQANDFRFLSLIFGTLQPAAATTIQLSTGSSQFADATANLLSIQFASARADVQITGSNTVPEPNALALTLLALSCTVAAALRGKRRLLGAVAGALVLSGPSLAQQRPQSEPQAARVADVDAVVIKVQGMRIQLRDAQGREFWVTSKSEVGSDLVGKRMTGQATPRGDSMVIANPVVSRAR